MESKSTTFNFTLIEFGSTIGLWLNWKTLMQIGGKGIKNLFMSMSFATCFR